MERYRQHPAPARVGVTPVGAAPSSPDSVMSFALAPYISTTPGPAVTSHDVFAPARGIRVENYSFNAVAVVFGSAASSDVLRAHDLLVPPYSIAQRPYSGSMVTVARMPDLAAVAQPGGQGIKVSFSAMPLPESLISLPEMGPAATAQPRAVTSYTAPASTVYTSRQWSLAPNATAYISQFGGSNFPPQRITGVDLFVASTSPANVAFSLVPSRASGTVYVPEPSGELQGGDAITIAPGGYFGLALSLDPTADVQIVTPATAGSYGGQILIKGY